MITVTPVNANGFYCKAFTLGAGSGDMDHIYLDGGRGSKLIRRRDRAEDCRPVATSISAAHCRAPGFRPPIRARCTAARFYSAELTAQQVQNTCAGMVAEVASRGCRYRATQGCNSERQPFMPSATPSLAVMQASTLAL